MSSAMPGRFNPYAEETRRLVEELQEMHRERVKAGRFGSLPPPIDPYTPAEQALADAPVNIRQPAPRMGSGMPGMSAFPGSGSAQAAMPPGFKIGGQVGTLGGEMMIGGAPPGRVREGFVSIPLPEPAEPARDLPLTLPGNMPRPPADIPSGNGMLAGLGRTGRLAPNLGTESKPIWAENHGTESKPIWRAPSGIPLPPPRPPEFGQSPGGAPPMASMPGNDFSTMLDIARGGPGMGGMGVSAPQPPQQPFGKGDLVSKMERPLGGILDGMIGGDPKTADLGGMLGKGGIPPWQLMNLFGGGFGGF